MKTILFVALLAGCGVEETSVCTTTLWAERPYSGPIILGQQNPRTEIYAAEVTVREVEGSPCEAEAALTKKQRPMAWTHDCGCEKTSP